jgi:type IV pilus assembly protein PilQ
VRFKNLFILLFSLAAINVLAGDPKDTLAAKKEASAERTAAVGKANRIKDILVNKGDDGLTIDIIADRDYRYEHYQLRNPDRLVIDFYDVINKVSKTSIPINQWSVKSVRVGQFKAADPMITRVVVDLQDGKTKFKILPQGASLRLLLEKASPSVSENKVARRETQNAGRSSQPAPTETADLDAAKADESVSDQSIVIQQNLDALESLANTNAALPRFPVDAPPAPVQKPEAPAKIAALKENGKPSTTPEAKVTALAAPMVKDVAAAEVPVPNSTLAAAPKTNVSTPVKLAPLAASTIPPSVPAKEEKASTTPATPALQPEMRKYSGEPISLDFKDGDLVDFFRLLSQITGLNIVLDPSIKGTLSLKMVNVPYDQVFDVVLDNNGLDKKIEGNVVRVARKSTLRQEEDERRKLKEAQALAADTVTKTIKLNYATADGLSKTLTKHLSAKGEIVTDPRTNTLIVKDIPEPLTNIERLIRVMDIPQPQVEIEARIVSATRDFARDIGVQLGLVDGNLERVTVGGPNVFGTIGGSRPSQSPTNRQYVAGSDRTGRGSPGGTAESGGVSTGIGGNTVGNYISNLPAQQPYRFSGFGISLGNIFDTFLLDASITAGESRGLAKLISQPKVTVQNNTEANVTQGLRFPVQVIQNNTVTVQFFDAALRLVVTPQITEEGTVLLELKVENNVADFSRTVGNIPSIRTSESRTRVLVGDGGTTVIAGIMVDSENRLEQKAPGIGSLPIVGNLFKRRFSDRSTQEVLFFVTPRIRKQGL